LPFLGHEALAPIEGYDVTPLAQLVYAGSQFVDDLTFEYDVFVRDIGVGVVSRNGNPIGTIFSVVGAPFLLVDELVRAGKPELLAGERIWRARHGGYDTVYWPARSALTLIIGSTGETDAFLTKWIGARSSRANVPVARRNCHRDF
jgi:hypothetical protein